ncbi:MAG: hypothetical protein ABSG66_03655 [Stellaceae bacterium]|jgi:hypothetical protein
MHDRWPATLAMTVCSIAVLSTGVASFVALSLAARPAALGLGGLGLIAAFLGLFAVIQWVRQAEETDPDYRYYRAVRIKARRADHALAAANEREPAAAQAARPAARPEGRVVPLRADAAARYGGNVVLFDPVKARRNRIRPL